MSPWQVFKWKFKQKQSFKPKLGNLGTKISYKKMGEKNSSNCGIDPRRFQSRTLRCWIWKASHWVLGPKLPGDAGQVSSKGIKITPQIHIRNFVEHMAWEWMCLSGVHLWHLQGPHQLREPCGCQKWIPERYPPPSHLFFKFSNVNLGSDFDPFWENLTCT